MTPISRTFSPHGPFDRTERATVVAVYQALDAQPGAASWLKTIHESRRQLERLGEVLNGYPSLFMESSVGDSKRDLQSLVNRLTAATPANFEMFLPGRAQLSRVLVMGEVNFYRLLRAACCHILSEERRAELVGDIDHHLCHALYTRLAETVLTSIVSDNNLSIRLRDTAGMALAQIWENSTYRVEDFFPVLEATWEARRKVPATLGTLMGTSEMFRLLEAGGDERFVDWLARPEHTEDEEAAFREFLFGTTTEQLGELQARMAAEGKHVIGVDELPPEILKDACSSGTDDPSLAMYGFFLSRHLQASARRHAQAPGPKRTAEEYVMLYFLEHEVDRQRLSIPPR